MNDVYVGLQPIPLTKIVGIVLPQKKEKNSYKINPLNDEKDGTAKYIVPMSFFL